MFFDIYSHLKISVSQFVVQFRLTRPELYFLKIKEFSHYNEYGVLCIIGKCIHAMRCIILMAKKCDISIVTLEVYNFELVLSLSKL